MRPKSEKTVAQLTVSRRGFRDTPAATRHKDIAVKKILISLALLIAGLLTIRAVGASELAEVLAAHEEWLWAGAIAVLVCLLFGHHFE